MTYEHETLRICLPIDSGYDCCAVEQEIEHEIRSFCEWVADEHDIEVDPYGCVECHNGINYDQIGKAYTDYLEARLWFTTNYQPSSMSYETWWSRGLRGDQLTIQISLDDVVGLARQVVGDGDNVGDFSEFAGWYMHDQETYWHKPTQSEIEDFNFDDSDIEDTVCRWNEEQVEHFMRFCLDRDCGRYDSSLSRFLFCDFLCEHNGDEVVRNAIDFKPVDEFLKEIRCDDEAMLTEDAVKAYREQGFCYVDDSIWHALYDAGYTLKVADDDRTAHCIELER